MLFSLVVPVFRSHLVSFKNNNNNNTVVGLLTEFFVKLCISKPFPENRRITANPQREQKLFHNRKIGSRKKSLIPKIILLQKFQGNFSVEGKLACTRLSVSADERKKRTTSPPQPSRGFSHFFPDPYSPGTG